MAKGFFEEANGNKSILRLVWAITTITMLGVWAYIAIKNAEWFPFQLSDIGMFATLFAGKVAQKYLEGY